LKETAQANMDAVADGVAQSFARSLEAKAPIEQQVPGYRKGIKVWRNTDGSRSVVVNVAGTRRGIGSDEKVLLTFKAKNKDALKSSTWVLLKGFGPWTPKSLLVNVDSRLFETRYFKARDEEFEAVEKKQASQRARLAKAASAAGIPLLPRPKSSIDASEDLSMKILRVEKGVDFSFAAHWIPSLRTLRARKLFTAQDDFVFSKLRPLSFPLQTEADLDSQSAFTKALV
jgi:hypothetical protein